MNYLSFASHLLDPASVSAIEILSRVNKGIIYLWLIWLDRSEIYMLPDLTGRVGQGQRLVQKAYPHIISRKKKRYYYFFFCQGITESLSQRFKTINHDAPHPKTKYS